MSLNWIYLIIRIFLPIFTLLKVRLELHQKKTRLKIKKCTVAMSRNMKFERVHGLQHRTLPTFAFIQPRTIVCLPCVFHSDVITIVAVLRVGKLDQSHSVGSK